MHYHHITTATFLSRPNRFIAQVRLSDGTEETVHVKNTGRCKELLIPGCTVYLEKSENPNRKTLYDLVAVEKRYDQVSNWKNYPSAFRKRIKNGMGFLCNFHESIQSGRASNRLISFFQGKEIQQENSIGAFASSREPYLWSPTRGNPRLENCTRIW